MSGQPNQKQHPIALPQVSALCVNAAHAALLTDEGEIQQLSHEQVKQLIKDKPVILCHAPYTAKQLGCEQIIAFDILELFAFIHPGKFCVPTITGVAKALGVTPPTDFEDQTFTLLSCAQALLSDLRQDIWQAKANPLHIAGVMGAQGKGWLWTPYIYAALGEEYDPQIPVISKSDLNIWKNLPEWSEEAPPPPPDHHPVTKDESRERLKQLLGAGAEEREQQASYTSDLTQAFLPKDEEDEPHVVVAEAGTGVGKTLGYLAPSSIWAEKNKGSVWVSTYTKNLQRQVDQELTRLYPDEQLKDNKVAIRKGRENYLCLLNYEENAGGAALSRDPRQAIALGLMARWIAATKDGDLMSGSDFPGWLSGLLGYKYTYGLSDRRGECIYSSCDHYHRCFVEQSQRRSKHANIVVANHALVMVQAAIATNAEDIPKRLVFDEGHHLFDAADSAFAGHLTAQETYDLRRWLRGAESSTRTRMKGLKSRAEDLVSGDETGAHLLQDIIQASSILTTDGWQRRLKDQAPKGICETFIHAIYTQVYNRGNGQNSPFSIEIPTFPLTDDVATHIEKLQSALKELQKPMLALAEHLRKKLNEQAETLNSDTKKRIEAVQTGLDRRAQMSVGSWVNMLETLKAGQSNPEFTDWMQIERIDGRAVDIGLYRHWVNPMVPFANTIKSNAHGVVITSATLRDGTDSEEDNWKVASDFSGASLLSSEPSLSSYSSPFDYKNRTKVIIVQDVRKDSLEQVASAYRTLFQASKGGAIGLFTAISRLKSIYQEIKQSLESSDISLYGQHMDEMDAGTLVDIFRDDENSCLLGTDAIRDGVDVPGKSLRLMVFDRVPWPRPTILHKSRREAFGGRRYDDRLTRLKLKQAYGRLIRRVDDKGVFVMLDSMMPSRLYGAFPDGVEVQKLGLADAIKEIKEFLHD